MPSAQDAIPVPEAALDPLDWRHLERTTFADADLAREVLGMFVAQVDGLADDLRAPAGSLAMPLHRLTGAARAVGAWPIAEAAQMLERNLASPDAAALGAILAARIATARAVIVAHLRTDAGGAGVLRTDSL